MIKRKLLPTPNPTRLRPTTTVLLEKQSINPKLLPQNTK